MKDSFTISQVAKQTAITLHTLRYYERIGLIIDIERADNGHRQYSYKDIVWIRFLKRLRKTGMPISDMQRFANLRRQGDGSLDMRRKILETHYDDVINQIVDLEENLAAIENKIKRLSKKST